MPTLTSTTNDSNNNTDASLIPTLPAQTSAPATAVAAGAGTPDETAAPPPAYTPYTLPPYTHFDPESDRRNYAISLLMHNLNVRHDHEGATPIPVWPENPDRMQRAALRDFQASQDPDQWGLRAGRRTAGGRREEEPTGFWNWLLQLFTLDHNPVDEDRARYLTGMPIWVTPNGAL